MHGFLRLFKYIILKLYYLLHNSSARALICAFVSSFTPDLIVTAVSVQVRFLQPSIIDLIFLAATGAQELTIENYRGIQEYSELLIRVQTGSGEVCIKGKNLWIEYYTNLEMLIRGRIIAVEFKN